MKNYRMFVALAALTAFAGMNSLDAKAAKVCQGTVVGTGEAKANTPLARARAEQSWSKVAVNTYGTGHGIWLKAEQRSMTCTITGNFPKTHSCVARAIPCK